MHGDLHVGNVARRNGRLAYFDWTDACVAHPFVDLHSLRWARDEAERAAQLDATSSRGGRWRRARRLREAAALAGVVIPLHHAVSYRTIVAGLEPASHSPSSTSRTHSCARCWPEQRSCKVHAMREAHAGRLLVEAVNHGEVKRSAPSVACAWDELVMMPVRALALGAAMLPAAWPALRLYRGLGTELEVVLFAMGYLAVWVLVAGVAMLVMAPAGPLLAVAGLYQLGPVQAASLRRCRAPLGLLMRRSGLRAGVEYAIACAGCAPG